MLSCPHQHHPMLRLHRIPHPSPAAASSSSSLHFPQDLSPPATATPQDDPPRPRRTHNANLLLPHLNQIPPQSSQLSSVPGIPAHAHLGPRALDPPPLVLSTHKRAPQFPGTVSRQVPLDRFNEERGEEEDMEVVMRALEVRRKVAMEVFKQEMMRKGKFGITYSTNLVERLLDCGFVDFLMVEAVNLKRVPEFEGSSFNVRVQAVVARLEVVPLVRWLKHNGVSYPKIAKAIGLSRGNVGSIRSLAEWLKTVRVKGEFLGVVMTKAGEHIVGRSLEELDEIVMYLENNGVRNDWMGFVLSRCPQLLCYSIEEVRTRVAFYMDMGMNENDFGTMVFDFPRVLGHYSLDEMNQKVNYMKEFGLTNEDVGKLIAFKPQLMACGIEDKWKPLVKYFYYLGISRDGLRRMLKLKPMVFCIDLEQTIVPKVKFFQDIGIRDEAIGDMLVKFPSLLTYSLYKKIRPVVIFLMTRAGVSEKDIAKVIASGPELLGSSIGRKLEMNMKYFLSLGIRTRQLGEMIADFPMLLRYNIDLLRPKYRYLRRTMVRPLKDLIEFPRYFSYSLDNRIIPRHKVMVVNRVNFKLRYMLGCTDEEFMKKVEAAIERRRKYEEFPNADQLTDGSSKEETVVNFSQSGGDISDSEVDDHDPIFEGEDDHDPSVTRDFVSPESGLLDSLLELHTDSGA